MNKREFVEYCKLLGVEWEYMPFSSNIIIKSDDPIVFAFHFIEVEGFTLYVKKLDLVKHPYGFGIHAISSEDVKKWMAELSKAHE